MKLGQTEVFFPPVQGSLFPGVYVRFPGERDEKDCNDGSRAGPSLTVATQESLPFE